MGIEIKYKKDELVMKFTDAGWEVWIAICLFKNLYNTRWDFHLTDRDRGFIENVYRDMENSGVDFDKFNAGVTKDNIGVKDSLCKITKQLENLIEHLKRSEPTLKIVYDKDIKLEK